MRFGLVLITALALLPASAGAAKRTAHVSVSSLAPVVVGGAGFMPRERVTVTVSSKQTRTKKVTASSRDTFRVRFAGFSIGRCDPYAVRANGNRGSTAFVKVTPECAPQAPDADNTTTTTGDLFPTDPGSGAKRH